ncbi:SU10 major capsid protein [Bacillus paralicheniformis]|uniref:SU10 major capsid protein n=1 Tax=Bacillus paralicheniformis TaxID=1648923 RepID=UPI00307D6BA5
MAVAQSYDFQQQVRDMQANVDLILTKAPVLFGLIGTGDALSQTKFEWQNDYLNSDTAVVKTAAAADATEVELGEGEARKFTENALVQNGLEVMRVTKVDEAAEKITVQRGYDATTPEAVEAGADLKVISRPRPEGESVFRKNEINDRIVSFNYSQIFTRYASVSRTQQQVNTYGVADELDYQVNLRLQEMVREINNSLIYGRKYQGSGQQPRTSGGLFAFAQEQGSASTDFGGKEITAKGLNDAIEETFKRGGRVNTILCAPNVSRQITKLAGDTIRTTRGEGQVGYQIMSFMSDLPGGAVSQVVVDQNMPKDRAVLLNLDNIKARYLTSIYDQDATEPGADYFARVIRGELGFEIKNAKESVAILSGISKTVS